MVQSAECGQSRFSFVGPGLGALEGLNVEEALRLSAALSAELPTAPMDRVTAAVRQASAKARELYWVSSTGGCNTGLLK